MAILKSNRSAPPAWAGIATGRFRSGVARGRSIPGKAVGAFVPGLTRKAFEKFGFSAATLIMDWPRIAGADLAQWTTPERLKWPQGFEGAQIADDAGGRPGATLVLRVDPARALDVEYRARQIVERINSYFGYRAIADLRLLQAPVAARPAATPAARTPVAPAVDLAYGDEPLGRALARLEAGVRAASRGT
jgi:hypothetical protein